MEEILQQILDELRDMNQKLDDTKGFGINNSLSDVCDKLDEMLNGYDFSNVCSKLDDVCSKLDMIELNAM